jgi:hypothetical protein
MHLSLNFVTDMLKAYGCNMPVTNAFGPSIWQYVAQCGAKWPSCGRAGLLQGALPLCAFGAFTPGYFQRKEANLI